MVRLIVNSCVPVRKPGVAARFGTTNRQDSDQGYHVDHYSKLFRDDLDWNGLVEQVAQIFPKQTKVPVFSMGCSDGSEAYSLALKLVAHFGLPEASARFFPIDAFDKMPGIIRHAKEHAILLTQPDIKMLRETLKPMGYRFEALFESADPKTFPPEPASDTAKRFNTPSKYYMIKGFLRDAVTFREADMLQEPKRQGAQRLFQSPALVLLRNAWPYLDKADQYQLAQDCFRNLPSGSVLVCGEYDLKEGWANEALKAAGFQPLNKTLLNISTWKRQKNFHLRGGRVSKSALPTEGAFRRP
jgi:chemotaxis methyl-accepting protein methylase